MAKRYCIRKALIFPALTLAVAPGVAEHGHPRLSEGVKRMSSPVLIAPAAMAGDWRLVREDGATCSIRFEPSPAGEGYALLADAACLAAIGLGGVSLWRPSSDGIGLADPARETFAFFARETPARFRWPAVGAARIVLERR